MQDFRVLVLDGVLDLTPFTYFSTYKSPQTTPRGDLASALKVKSIYTRECVLLAYPLRIFGLKTIFNL